MSVDYTVPDWRFIVTDNNLTTRISEADQTYFSDQGVTPTPVAPRQLVLPTRYVADEPLSNAATLTNRPSQLYTLLRGSTPAGAPAAPAVNDWSQDKYPTATASMSGATTANRAIAVRPKSGQVFFDVNDLVSPSARVVYRNAEGWVQQPAIAARFYLPYTEGTAPNSFPREPWREYFYKAGATTLAEKPLFFHASEAGKSITASYVYQEGSNPPITMRDVPIPIEADVQDRPAVVPALFNGDYYLNGTETALRQSFNRLFAR